MSKKPEKRIHIWEVHCRHIRGVIKLVNKKIYILLRDTQYKKLKRRTHEDTRNPTIFEHAKEIWIEKVNTEQKYHLWALLANFFLLRLVLFFVTERKAKRRHQRIIKFNFFLGREGIKGRGREHFRLKNVNH